MVRYVVIIDGSDASERLLYKAGETAKATASKLLVVALHSSGENTDQIDKMWGRIQSEISVTRPDSPGEVARVYANKLSDRVLSDKEVNYTTRGEHVTSTSISDRIIELAEIHDSEHIFIPGKQRSPTGKAIFGDTTQSVILNFDGFVTVAGE